MEELGIDKWWREFVLHSLVHQASSLRWHMASWCSVNFADDCGWEQLNGSLTVPWMKNMNQWAYQAFLPTLLTNERASKRVLEMRKKTAELQSTYVCVHAIEICKDSIHMLYLTYMALMCHPDKYQKKKKRRFPFSNLYFKEVNVY